MSSTPKLCCICGTDVASTKRVKDQRGRYFCQTCARARQAQPVAAPAPIDAAVAAPPEDDGLLDLAPVRDHAPKDQPMAACGRCKKLLPERQVRNLDGEFVCNPCFSQQNRPQPAAKAKPRPETKTKGSPGVGVQTAAAVEDENAEGKFGDSLAGGAVISCAVLASSVAVYFALYKFLPVNGISSTLECLVAAGANAVILLMSTVGLILSMIIAARIMGGITFGYIGPVVYKSILFCLGLSVLGFFAAHFDSMAIIVIGFRYLVILGALIALFKIDYFEAFLLAVVNWGMNIGLAILLTIMLHAFAGAIDKSKNADNDAPDDIENAAPNVPNIPQRGGAPNNPDPGVPAQPPAGGDPANPGQPAINPA